MPIEYPRRDSFSMPCARMVRSNALCTASTSTPGRIVARVAFIASAITFAVSVSWVGGSPNITVRANGAW